MQIIWSIWIPRVSLDASVFKVPDCPAIMIHRISWEGVLQAGTLATLPPSKLLPWNGCETISQAKTNLHIFWHHPATVVCGWKYLHWWCHTPLSLHLHHGSNSGWWSWSAPVLLCPISAATVRGSDYEDNSVPQGRVATSLISFSGSPHVYCKFTEG